MDYHFVVNLGAARRTSPVCIIIDM